MDEQELDAIRIEGQLALYGSLLRPSNDREESLLDYFMIHLLPLSFHVHVFCYTF